MMRFLNFILIQKQEAILMYEKSIAMNPRNEPGKKMLALIMGK